MLFDLKRNALHQVVSYGCLNANSCLTFMQPTFYNCPPDQISLAGHPTDLFGAGTTAPVSTVQSTPCQTTYILTNMFGPPWIITGSISFMLVSLHTYRQHFFHTRSFDPHRHHTIPILRGCLNKQVIARDIRHHYKTVPIDSL